MPDAEVVETTYGKYHKYEIVEELSGVLGSVKFYVRRDGKPFKGPYSSVAAAVEGASGEG